ncbi:4-hydroxybenzoate polyprenyltransferase, mitochondrial [Plodia interpunctella]|uniref:4-hydroxybenzoate polyprenyltransferase, mitochondrial n=1 Tax=Plodia interpunctella TaxID=58824 RepID=UPI002367427A|nr:4-hydroxybenzoate polyprenyltransferase, mitochondrial [Plodia interpunctella]XP_053622922.1 4-hydroxybenzoate polyprenyltransferase, mitochondrial [Plodia interpunctella]
MFNRSLINYKFPYKILYLTKYDHNLKRQLKTVAKCPLTSYQRLDYRVHSTQSDSHRQKVVIETTVPKILVDKKKFNLWESVEPYIKLARWDKPIGVYLLYWPCTWSIALGSLAGTAPLHTTIHTAVLFLAGAGLMRGAGCTINDLWDRDIDAQVERTKDRPLVSGAVTPRRAVCFLAAQLTLALGVLLQLNCYSVVLGASSVFLVVTYPLAKRFTNYPQLFLGATFNWGALLGYSALQGTLDPAVCLPLYAAALAWTVIYDTIYAHQDKLDDARIGMKSTALTFGAHTKPVLSVCLFGSVSALTATGVAADMGPAYYVALALYGGHVGRQIYTLDVDNPNDCANKFKSNSLVGLIILLGILGGGYSQYTENRKRHMGKENLDVIKSCVFS